MKPGAEATTVSWRVRSGEGVTTPVLPMLADAVLTATGVGAATGVDGRGASTTGAGGSTKMDMAESSAMTDVSRATSSASAASDVASTRERRRASARASVGSIDSSASLRRLMSAGAGSWTVERCSSAATRASSARRVDW